MADKTEEKNIEYWHSKLSSKLPELKYIVRAFGGWDKKIIYQDEETFLAYLLKLISQTLSSRGGWLSAVVLQPSDYEQMMAYKCLKENDKLNDTKKLAEKMISLSLKLDLKRIDSHSTKDELIAAYKDAVKDFFSFESEYKGLLKTVFEDMTKSTEKQKEKDVYIG